MYYHFCMVWILYLESKYKFVLLLACPWLEQCVQRNPVSGCCRTRNYSKTSVVTCELSLVRLSLAIVRDICGLSSIYQVEEKKMVCRVSFCWFEINLKFIGPVVVPLFVSQSSCCLIAFFFFWHNGKRVLPFGLLGFTRKSSFLVRLEPLF